MNVFGQLLYARIQQTASDLADTISGLIWQNTTTSRIKYYNGSEVKELVELDSTQTLTGKTLTGNTAVNLSPDGVEVLTLPVATDTLVGKATTDTLTNKTITGNIAANLSPDGAEVVTLPIATDTLVGKATTDTLTNKTLESPVINSPSISTPSKLDAKQDTFANLETYALTASNGQLCFATDSKDMYHVVDGVLQPIGSGGGGAGENVLENPSFESGVSDWTLTAGTGTSETSNVVHLDKAYKATLSAQALELYQDSTLHASQFNGQVQGIVYVRVKTTVAGIKVSARKAGATSSTLTIDVNNNGEWGLYKIPVVLGATSNGISIHSDGAAVTGDVYVDDAFVGAVSVTSDTSQIVLAGESYFPGTASANISRSSTTIGPFTSNSAFPPPTISHQFLGQWQTTDSDLPKQIINNLPAGKYEATFTVVTYNPSSGYGALTISDGTTTCPAVGVEQSSTQPSSTTVSCIFDYSEAGDRYFELYGASATGAITIINTNVAPSAGTKFSLKYYGASSTYSMISNSDTELANDFNFLVESTGAILSEDYGVTTSAWSTGSSKTLNGYKFDLTSLNLTSEPTINVTQAEDQAHLGRDVNYYMPDLDTLYVSIGDGSVYRQQKFSMIIGKTGDDRKIKRTIVGDFAQLAQVATIKDVKASGTAGGAFASGSFLTRTLNTLEDSSGIVSSLSSNQFTLPAGTYFIEASAPAYGVDRNLLRLRNITDSSDSIIGQNAFAESGSGAGTTALLMGEVTITSSKIFELQHRCNITGAAGFGLANSFGVDEVYSQVKIRKLK